MTVNRNELVNILSTLLRTKDIKDFCPNGLQVEGRSTIKKIVTGVTASQALIDKAIDVGADTLLVHHGYFWKGESQPIVGMKQKRIKALLENNINLVAYHLPLDVHQQYGNNVQLGQLLGINDIQPLSGLIPSGIVCTGTTASSVDGENVKQLITDKLKRDVLWVGDNSPINTIAWCTGGGQNYIEAAADAGIDAFITGEVSEQTVHVARERGIHFFSAGHHATERYGVKALGEWIAQQYSLDVQFIDIPNPA